MLGAIFAILSAASFALNTAMARRGVVSGTPIQGMAVTVPLGVVCFLPLAFLTGELMRLPQFSMAATAWMAAVGVVHFIIGRYCNFRSNAEAGVNLTAPVVQLQVVVTMVMAVVVLHEPCTLLQMIGGALIICGSVLTQQAPARTAAAPPSDAKRHEEPARLPWSARAGRSLRSPARVTSGDAPKFAPRYVAGYLFASLAAVSYGSTPVMARFALENTGPATGVLGGLISYAAATAVAALALILPAVRRNVFSMNRHNARWFAASGVFVAAAQGFFFAGVAVAPVMLVMPLLQFSLVFRMLFSTWLNPAHEIIGPLVLAGTAISIVGALMVSVDTSLIVSALGLPEPLARALLWRV
ncbi:MAG: DMT family transporter [Xanthobacteraceae bacterium]|nr:DMT family transporter [Xanthobacteraceae bacterium]